MTVFDFAFRRLGLDTRTGIIDSYRLPVHFTGTIQIVVFTLAKDGPGLHEAPLAGPLDD